MKIGYIGLGKMGFNMVERLKTFNHQLVVYDTNTELVQKAHNLGIETAQTLKQLVEKLPNQKIIWIMVPHQFVDDVLTNLVPYLNKGDCIIDGGNSNYKESVRRGKELSDAGVNFLDVGVSGGPSGAKDGACLMIGGSEEIFIMLKELFKDIAYKGNAYAYLGKCGAGHFAKMVHNGIEYGMMQSIAEGFAILKQSEFNFDLLKVSQIYNNKSVIESRLIEWLEQAFVKHGNELSDISGEIDASGEGKWTVETAKEMNLTTPSISGSVEFRTQSKGNPSFIGKVVSALRNQFGGHDVQKK